MASLRQDARSAAPMISEEEHDEGYASVDVGGSDQEWDGPSPEAEEAGRETSDGSVATGKTLRNTFISDGVAAWLDDNAEDPGKNPSKRPWTAMDDTKLQQLMLAWLSCAGLQTTADNTDSLSVVESAIDATYRYRLHKWLQHSYEDNYQMIVDCRKDITQALQPVAAMWDAAEAPIFLDPRVQRSPAVQALPKVDQAIPGNLLDNPQMVVCKIAYDVIRDMPVADQAFWDALDLVREKADRYDVLLPISFIRQMRRHLG
eukprot:gene9574-6859_t